LDSTHLLLLVCSLLVTMKRTPAAKRQLIVHLLKEGLSTHEVAARAKVHQSTVSRIKRQENIEQKNVKRGRPRIVSDRIAKKLSTKVRSGELQNAVQARKFLEETTSLSVSTQTVRNVLAKDGLEAAPKIEKPKISKANMKKRLEFARKHQYWTVDDWKRIIWSDESKINRMASDGRTYCWRDPTDKAIR
jgi:transposase